MGVCAPLAATCVAARDWIRGQTPALRARSADQKPWWDRYPAQLQHWLDRFPVQPQQLRLIGRISIDPSRSAPSRPPRAEPVSGLDNPPAPPPGLSPPSTTAAGLGAAPARADEAPNPAAAGRSRPKPRGRPSRRARLAQLQQGYEREIAGILAEFRSEGRPEGLTRSDSASVVSADAGSTVPDLEGVSDSVAPASADTGVPECAAEMGSSATPSGSEPVAAVPRYSSLKMGVCAECKVDTYVLGDGFCRYCLPSPARRVHQDVIRDARVPPTERVASPAPDIPRSQAQRINFASLNLEPRAKSPRRAPPVVRTRRDPTDRAPSAPAAKPKGKAAAKPSSAKAKSTTARHRRGHPLNQGMQ